VKRIAVLASGGGSNLESILAHLESLGRDTPAQVAVVASDRPQAGALQKARDRQISSVVLHQAADPLNRELAELLVHHRVDLVVLAGYLRLVPAPVVDAFADRMVNIHPALLPLHGGPGMYGIRVHQAVLDARERVSGATVHFVTHEYDRGPIIAQWPIAVLPDDDARSLAARVLTVEHALYPRVVAALAAGKRDHLPLKPSAEYFANPPISAEAIAGQIDALLAG
jgi:phosphoribosylglycinamide formyltransferase 1